MTADHPDPTTSKRFKTTRWSLIQLLQSGDKSAADRAMAELARIYWSPINAHFEFKTKDRGLAEELTQEYFTTVVLHRNLLGTADPGRGQLRSLMRAAADRFLIDAYRKQRTTEPLPEQIAPHDVDPFEQEWVRTVLNEALRRARHYFEQSGRHGHWQAYERAHLRPTISHNAAPSMADIAEPLGFGTPARATAACQTVRKRIRALLEEVVAETVADPADVAGELALLRSRL